MFVGIVSLMFIFFINYHVVDTIECLNLFYMPIQNEDKVLRGPHNLGYGLPRPYDGHWSLDDEEAKGNRELHCGFLSGTPEQAIHIHTLYLQVYI
jgi:hypothetical protein